jgi:hypothetical protein
LSGVVDGRLLRGAVRAVRRRASAGRALELLLPEELAAAARVEGLDGGTLTVSVADPASWEQMRRRRGALCRQLGSTVPGLRELRVTLMPQRDPRAG